MRHASRILEWHEHYLDYYSLKDIIVAEGAQQQQQAESEAGNFGLLMIASNDVQQQAVHGTLTTAYAAGSEFRDALRKEVKKMEDFYELQLAELIDTVADIAARVTVVQQTEMEGRTEGASHPRGISAPNRPAFGPAHLRAKSLVKVERATLRVVLMEAYRAVHRLYSFGAVNASGVRKIIKKWRKRQGGGASAKGRAVEERGDLEDLLLEVEGREASREGKLDEMMADVEGIFASLFCKSSSARAIDGSLSTRELNEARAQLQMRQHDWSTFMLGWRMGVVFVLLIWLLWDVTIDAQIRPTDVCYAEVQDYHMWSDPAVALYHLCASMVLTYWCYGVIIVATRRVGIATAFVLGVRLPSPRKVFSRASGLTIALLLNFSMFWKVCYCT